MKTYDLGAFKAERQREKRINLQLASKVNDPNIIGNEVFNVNMEFNEVPAANVEDFVAMYSMPAEPYETFREFEESFKHKFLSLNVLGKPPHFYQAPVILNAEEIAGVKNPYFTEDTKDLKLETYSSFDILGRIGKEGFVVGDAKAYSVGGKRGDCDSKYHFVGTPYNEGILISRNPNLNIETSEMLEAMFEQRKVSLELKSEVSLPLREYLQDKVFRDSRAYPSSTRAEMNPIVQRLYRERSGNEWSRGGMNLTRYGTIDNTNKKKRARK